MDAAQALAPDARFAPTELERDKALAAPPEGRDPICYCIHCERTYPRGYFRQRGIYQMCPYADCDGDAFGDAWEWRDIRQYNPHYPEAPELSVVYPMYGPQTQRAPAPTGRKRR